MRDRFERFYGMALSDDVLAAVTERLTDQETEDLVQAHIGRNWSYFGAVDKTLSGFVILDDTDDNYTLLDVRDGGQVWWQDHETRDIYLRTDSLDDYDAWRAAVAKASAETDDWVDEDDYLDEYAATEARGSRLVPTSEMLERFQWLVWACAQPMQRDGIDTQSVDDLTRSTLGNFEWYWKERDLEGSFERELPTLTDDPHLAIYWLLHAIWLGESARAERVIEALPEARPALLQAFVDAADNIGPQHVLSGVPKFRKRKAHLALYDAFGLGGVDRARRMLDIMAIDATEMSYLKAWQIVPAVEAGGVSADEVAEALEQIEPGSLGEALLRVVVDRERGAEESHAATELVTMLDEDVDWTEALECLWRSYRLVDDELVVPVVARLASIDRYHQRVAQMTAEIAEATGSDQLPPADVAAERLEHAEELKDLLMPLFEDPESWLSVTNALPEHLRLPAAQRIIVWAEVVGSPAVGWALEQLMSSDLEDRFDLIRQGLATLQSRDCKALIERVRDEVEGPEDPRIDFFFEVLDLPAPPPGDYSAEFSYDDKIKSAVLAIGQFAKTPEIANRVLDVLESSEHSKPRIQIVQKLLNMFEQETFIIPTFDDATAQRTARALIEMKQDDDIHARNAAGHQLYRFRHTGAEDVIREALDEYGARHVEDDSLDDLVANLYASLRSMNTESSRRALIERLYNERRSYWRLGSAIGEISTPEVHEQILATLVERPSAHAAAAYAAALRNFVNSDNRLADLGALIVDWSTPDDERDRQMLAYVLLETCAAALLGRRHALVKKLSTKADDLGAEPFSPYSSIDRGRDWVSPFEDEERAAALAFVMSGEADEKCQALRAAGATAREAQKPVTDLDDEALGLLAGATVSSRIFSNLETGEVLFEDRDGGFHYYDGYDVVEPDFEHVDNPATNAAEFFDGRSIDDRRMFWTDDGGNFVEFVRWGDRIVSYRGVNNGAFTTFGLIAPSEERAAELMTSFCDYPPAGYAETSPYYLPGRGAIVRKYYRALEDGSYDSQYEAVLDGSFCWQDDEFDSNEEAIAALEEYERKTFVDFSGQITCIEWMERLRRAEDMTFEEWLGKRKRDDGQDAAWHLRALEDVSNYMAEHGLEHLFEGFSATVEGPAPADELKAFADACTVPLDDEIAETWAEVGGARWTFNTFELRFLGPAEALSRREALRAHTKQWAANDDPEDQWRHVDAIAVNQDGTTVMMYVDRDWDARYANSVDAPDSFNCSYLYWALSSGMIDAFTRVLLGRQPVLGMLYYGQRWHDGIRYERYENGDRFWEILADSEKPMVATRAGKIGTAGRFEHHLFGDADAAVGRADEMIAGVVAEGFEKTTPDSEE